MGLRHALILCIIIGVWQGQTWRWPAFPPPTPHPVQAVVIPPAYTHLPPLYLIQNDRITAPAGSQITVRATDARRGLRVFGSALAHPVRLPSTAGAAAFVQVPLMRSGGVSLGRWTRWAHWAVTITPDRAPLVRWAGHGQRGARDSLVLPVIITDDYDGLSAALVLSDTRKPLAPLRLTAPGAGGVRRLVVDLSASDIAGQTLTVQIAVRDAAGQVRYSTPQRITVPERLYKTPLAQSLVEVRTWLMQLPPAARWKPPARIEARLKGETVLLTSDRLTHAPRTLQKAAIALQALDMDSPDLTADPMIRMGLRSGATALMLARSSRDVTAVSALLRNLADRAETGTNADARAVFEAARIALSEAIARAASPEERAALTEDLQQAFANLMRSLSAEAKDGAPPAQSDPTHLDDLLALMQEADRLAAAGDVAGAQAVLETLGQIMANLRLSPGAGSPNPSGPDRLTPLMDEQRRLADQTRRWMALDPRADSLDTLAQQQADLAQKAAGLPTVQNDMRAAAEALRIGDPEAALKHQKAAGRALGDAMAKARAARDPVAKALGAKDPLGRRSQLQKGASADPRAETRAILQRIQERLEDQGLPEDERRYLEDLIRSF
jgi:hypothetical protein